MQQMILRGFGRAAQPDEQEVGAAGIDAHAGQRGQARGQPVALGDEPVNALLKAVEVFQGDDGGGFAEGAEREDGDELL